LGDLLDCRLLLLQRVFPYRAWLFLSVVSEIFEEKKSRAAGIGAAPGGLNLLQGIFARMEAR
jgi:hypothetical protein